MRPVPGNVVRIGVAHVVRDGLGSLGERLTVTCIVIVEPAAARPVDPGRVAATEPGARRNRRTRRRTGRRGGMCDGATGPGKTVAGGKEQRGCAERGEQRPK